MKTNSPSVVRSAHRRRGDIMDTLVFMLVAILLPAWILGTLYLTFFPAGASAAADSQTIALVDGEDGSFDANSVADPNSVNSKTSETGSSGSGDSNSDSGSMFSGTSSSNNTGGNFNPNHNDAEGEFSAQQKSALEQRISALQSQLDTKSNELQQLRETSMQPTSTAANVDTTKYENQITQLTQQRNQLTDKVKTLEQKMSGGTADVNSAMSRQLSQLTSERDQLKMKLTSAEGSTEKIAQLDQEIKRLNNQSSKQKLTIQTLQNQLATAAQANPVITGNIPMAGNSMTQNQPLEFREWISSKGSKARLAFVRWEDDKIVVIDEAKKRFRLTLNRLSPKDQIYVNSKR